MNQNSQKYLKKRKKLRQSDFSLNNNCLEILLYIGNRNEQGKFPETNDVSNTKGKRNLPKYC